MCPLNHAAQWKQCNTPLYSDEDDESDKEEAETIRIYTCKVLGFGTGRSILHVTSFTEDDCDSTLLKCIECKYTELESSTRVMRELLASND